MTTPLGPELYWAIVTAIFTSLLWVPHILQRVMEMKPHDALRDPEHDAPTKAPWAQRAARAHTNAMENLPIFALFCIAIQMTGMGDSMTATAAMIYFYARVAHYIVYTLGLPWLRTPIFAVGFAAMGAIGLRLVGML